MILITDKQIDKAIAAIEKMDEKKYEKFFQDFGAKQPVLFDYIMAYSDAIQSDKARDEFIFIMSVIWDCYKQLKLSLGQVTVKEIEKTEKAQLKAWEKLNQLSEGAEEEKFINKFITQPALWNFMTETAVPDIKNIKKSNFSNDDDFAILYSCTKMVFGLLDEKVKKAEVKE
jgi:hypothetical protein